MKKFKFLVSILIALSILTGMFPVSALAAEEIDIDAAGVIIVELNSGEILYEKNKDAQLPEASVTKVMTALVALEACDNGSVHLTDTVTASDNCWDGLDEDSSNLGIQPGEQMTFENLLHCALIASANESCNIIAEHVAGNTDSFVKMMNDKARALGCTNTHYSNAHGLHEDDHYTSAYDQYLIFNAAMSYPKFREIISRYSYTVPATNMSEVRRINNTNSLIDEDSRFYYQYCIGGKTGSTSAAGYCLAAQAEYEDMRVISVVLGAGDEETEDGYTMKSFTETARLYRWAFTNFEWRELCQSYEMVTSVPVDMAHDTDHVNLQPASSLRILADVDISEDDITRDIVVYSERDEQPLEAPIEAGHVLGEMTVYLKGEKLASVKLVASNDVELSKIAYIKRSVNDTMSKWWVKTIAVILAVLLAGYILLVVRYHLIKRKRREAIRNRQERIAEERRNSGYLMYEDDIRPVFKDNDNDNHPLHR